MTDEQLRRLAAWVRSHGNDVSENIEEGYITIYTVCVDRAGNATREADRVRTLAGARAVLGY